MSLAKSLSSETQPNSFTCRGSRLGARGSGLGARFIRSVESPAPSPDSLLFIEAEAPADQRDGEAAVAQQGVMEAAQGEGLALRRFHDALLRYGGLPVTLIRWGLGLNEQEGVGARGGGLGGAHGAGAQTRTPGRPS